MGPGDVSGLLAESTAEEAQLILSLMIWPEAAPDPRVVDEWVRSLSGSANSRGTHRGTYQMSTSGTRGTPDLLN
jgi:hypothetical protein